MVHREKQMNKSCSYCTMITVRWAWLAQQQKNGRFINQPVKSENQPPNQINLPSLD